MRPLLACLTIAAAGAAAGGCDVAAMGPESRQHIAETRRLDAQGTVTVENMNGAIEVQAWTEASVSIEAEKVGPAGTLDDVRVEIEGEGGRVDVRTRHGREGWWGRRGRVDYRIKVPQAARVEVETTNGRVRVAGTAGDVRASTTNGSVEVADAAGNVEASTTNGSIKASYGRAPDGWQRMTTTNGSVTLTLPADATGDFDASTVNGGISTDFPLQASGRIGKRRLRGRLGDGPARFDIRTTNGAVKILKQGHGG